MGMGTGGTAIVLRELAKSSNVDIGVATLIFIAQMAAPPPRHCQQACSRTASADARSSWPVRY